MLWSRYALFLTSTCVVGATLPGSELGRTDDERNALRREVAISTAWGVLFTGALGVLIVVGSRNLAHFDAALVGYTFASLFAVFGLTYRYAMWLQRPPTALYWRRGWQVFFMRRHRLENAVTWVRRVVSDFALNRFILRRGRSRWVAHFLLMWGCLMAAAITFPLVFGWLHFETLPGDMETYRVFVFGFPSVEIGVGTLPAFLMFHGLVWSAVLVIGGVMLAMRRRMRDEGAVSLQKFHEDFLPLILLFAVSLTGLLLTASYTWMKGYAYDFLAIVHAVTVIFTLLWLPFGKFFHIFQRPAQLGVSFYKDVGAREEAASCRRCGHAFTSRMHVEDLIGVQRALGFRYEADGDVEHYQWICPPCRRALFAIAQGRPFGREVAARDPKQHVPTPVLSNPGLGSCPLGTEDLTNFHA